MKLTLFVWFLIPVTIIFAQTKPEAKPGFFSIVKLEETVGDFKLVSNYYPLKSNINNPMSAVFVSDTPNLDQIEKSALDVPSDFFYVSKNKVNLNKIMLLNRPVRKYFVASPQTGDMNEYDCTLLGDITENRAQEIVAEKVDSSARIEGGKFYFNNKEFLIISSEDIRKDVLALVSQYGLSASPAATPKKTTK